ncbi:hypothetical protein ATANTOWER_023691 [Ataeniobius toweri]|uniref:Uncharacterized protein n=1 Tax=Ataeniobius toweri TaxID=208326 RepID=A0ABU7AT65_9TELE|nr:hypothetical protein [Ataeniobius toweri]
MSKVPSVSDCLILILFLPPGFLCSALPTSDISLASDFWTLSLLLPPAYRPLPNPRIRLPESAFPCMTSFLCPDHRFKKLPQSVFPALTQFLSSDHRTLSIQWVCKPDYPFLCDVNLLSPDNHTEEPKNQFSYSSTDSEVSGFIFELIIILSSVLSH